MTAYELREEIDSSKMVELISSIDTSLKVMAAVMVEEAVRASGGVPSARLIALVQCFDAMLDPIERPKKGAEE